jgi:ubiquinol-cytochrome c reductase iron-sulfur subunit
VSDHNDLTGPHLAHPDDHEDATLILAGGSDPIPDPGIEPHEPRPTDVDEAMARRAERQVASMFGLASVLLIVFVACYIAFSPDAETGQSFLGFNASNFTLGLSLGGALLLIGLGAIQWAKKLMGDQEIVEYRHSAVSKEEDRAIALQAFDVGVEESGIGRRPLVRNSLLGALALLGLPTIIMLGDLGPLPGDAYSTTVWQKGVRVVNDVSGAPIKPEDVEIGQLINAEPSLFFPEEGPDGETIEPTYTGVNLQVEKTKAAVVVVRMPPEDITPLPSRVDWGVDGILCYSKICTHVGCPISLWEQQTHMLLCPCHQSTFDLADNGKVVFGPAARPLPQLHIGTDDEGYLIAMSGFDEPVGPSFWERG